MTQKQTVILSKLLSNIKLLVYALILAYFDRSLNSNCNLIKEKIFESYCILATLLNFSF